jgi:uncharacterized protein (DUF169 family)
MDKTMDFKEMQKILMDELRLMHYPIAVKFIFRQEELDDFMKHASYYEPVKPITFCQCEVAARMKGQTVLGTKEKLVCSNALFNFGWKALDEAEVKSHLKYTRDMDQALRFVKTKLRLPEGELKAFIVSPLADTYFIPDTVHFCHGCPSAATESDGKLCSLRREHLFLYRKIRQYGHSLQRELQRRQDRKG